MGNTKDSQKLTRNIFNVLLAFLLIVNFNLVAAIPAHALVVTPTVSGIVPTSGPTAGGTSITITGTNFVRGATVSIGGALATGVNWVEATSITAVTPAGTAGAKDVMVTNPDSQTGTLANGFTYISPAPTVTSLVPNTGGQGATLTGVIINGNNLSGVTAINFSGTGVTASGVNVVNATRVTATITITSNAALGPRDVTVTIPGATSEPLTGGFTVIVPPPTVSAIVPASGSISGGTAVTITGTGFSSFTMVTIGGTPATSVVFVNPTSISAVTPAGPAGPQNVVVQNGDHFGTLTNGFTYIVAPTVTSIAPPSGPTTGGTAVTITGTGFVSGARVTVGGAPANSVVWMNPTSITATTPPGISGPQNVIVSNPNEQSGTLAGGFIYVLPAVPTSPNATPTSGTIPTPSPTLAPVPSNIPSSPPTVVPSIPAVPSIAPTSGNPQTPVPPVTSTLITPTSSSSTLIPSTSAVISPSPTLTPGNIQASPTTLTPGPIPSTSGPPILVIVLAVIGVIIIGFVIRQLVLKKSSPARPSATEGKGEVSNDKSVQFCSMCGKPAPDGICSGCQHPTAQCTCPKPKLLKEGERLCTKCGLFKIVGVNCAGCGKVEKECICLQPTGKFASPDPMKGLNIHKSPCLPKGE
jgi:hypothetical protein